MPELPEVETLKRALLPLIKGKEVRRVQFFREDLRFPIPVKTLQRELSEKAIQGIFRKGKYLLLQVDTGSMLWHLGMSGRVTEQPSAEPVQPHTHAIFSFDSNLHLHFIDPRRFGAILWVPKHAGHKLLDSLGPDPLASTINAKDLREAARTCKGPIKHFIMNAKRIVGVGNIYACESLFAAGINPKRGAHRLSLKDWEQLLGSIQRTLQKAIAAGGTTLRDFFTADGTPGYFAIELAVYGKENHPCPQCKNPVTRIVQSNRSTFFCKTCQKK